MKITVNMISMTGIRTVYVMNCEKYENDLWFSPSWSLLTSSFLCTTQSFWPTSLHPLSHLNLTFSTVLFCPFSAQTETTNDQKLFLIEVMFFRDFSGCLVTQLNSSSVLHASHSICAGFWLSELKISVYVGGNSFYVWDVFVGFINHKVAFIDFWLLSRGSRTSWKQTLIYFQLV